MLMSIYNNNFFKNYLILISLLIGTSFNFYSIGNDSLKQVVFDTNSTFKDRLKAAYDVSWDMAKGYDDSAYFFANFMYENSKFYNEKEFLAKYFVVGFQMYINSGDSTEALNYCDSIIHYANLAGSKMDYLKIWTANRKSYFLKNIDLKIKYYDSLINHKDFKNNKKALEKFYYKLGILLTDKGDFKNGLVYLDSVLKYSKENLALDSNKTNVRSYANVLTVIGTVYYDRAVKENKIIKKNEILDEALFYFLEAKLIYKKWDFKYNLSLIFGNISDVFFEKEEFKKAINYRNKDLLINIELNDFVEVIQARSELAKMFVCDNQYESALKELDLIEKMQKEHKLSFSKFEEYKFFTNIGIVYDSTRNIKKALEFYQKAYKSALQSSSILWTEDVSKKLYKTYKKIGSNKKALEMYKQYILNRDSLIKMQAIEETMAMELARKYELKKQEDSIRNIEKKKLDQANLALKKTQVSEEKSFTIGVGILLIAILAFAILLLRRFVESIKQKKIITAQKIEVDDAFTLLEEKNKELVKKNSEIMDSIHYAKYIQQALLPDENEIKSFFGNEFVFNFPKDVVGGDFHWFKSYGDVAIIVAADCTGHGVPGGFVTILGSLLIENSVKEKPKNPNEILTDLNRGIVKLLKQHKKDAIQDGMDISVCLVDKKNRKIKFSGARNGLHIVKDRVIETYKGDLTPVGGYFKKNINFDERSYEINEISLEKDQWVFMYSDGYYDQFGGPKNKSMGSTRFKQVLQKAVNENKSNKDYFMKYFLGWKGKQEQIDDVLLIGFNLK